jgi:ppGpp synthetase/RelA/SpoT-type nucleotidyltranferase
MIEIQVRTSLQHLWAELSEKLSDIVDPAIKYGAGDKTARAILTKASALVIDMESLEIQLAETKAQLSSEGRLTGGNQQAIAEIEGQHPSMRQALFEILRDRIKHVEDLAGERS